MHPPGDMFDAPALILLCSMTAVFLAPYILPYLPRSFAFLQPACSPTQQRQQRQLPPGYTCALINLLQKSKRTVQSRVRYQARDKSWCMKAALLACCRFYEGLGGTYAVPPRPDAHAAAVNETLLEAALS